EIHADNPYVIVLSMLLLSHDFHSNEFTQTEPLSNANFLTAGTQHHYLGTLCAINGVYHVLSDRNCPLRAKHRNGCCQR
ncbi:MAG TPA: hypothetical protein PKI87_05680, partial [Arenimonas sp.]|nr:hypothetical protein [Arenimonas sp.]